ncbi:30S ribosomal protein S4 [Ehrlichia ruminantium]|uniref:Small ribosomal subunit protein uS4 n=1 Tax=Ehrlichia ruminantium (strain Welgevonden) TaxID=254945 RepID=RS4_EHRRW|nr:30S ribosomal protein S4 [Ehrlichia ruminantium]Q5HBY1.1 RecName: Full=Small ribosomal subunit protein uS4; AltName: Full=30S ribosomal protein S4 [Ehrlichia ruminantium str. Welgevonden]QLK54869.1 30S ribosomal protein S4 [Ehrlichia ruminantium]QLK55786.1 30S ribosomal protein S4 [Ehrlichia ruminantium]UOD99889.1 30S ribosomal protein S4 [Ehrlichia ruminantium]CAH57912.1 30S ribosomal protein S4 [Ehrlichia ruminantium str. Welgevonden]CAI26690.1 30S ribosomal protein S4 [Ehrlichia ruminan
MVIQRKYRASRRLGVSLWGRSKDPFNTRNYPPGQHGNMGYKKPSDFGKQFGAHKKFKFYYAISSKQMRNMFLKAYKKKGDTGDNFVGLLESMLSSVLYNSGLVPTIFSARQLISHKHVLVNGKVVNISSYSVKPGDTIKLREKAVNLPPVLAAIDAQEQKVPDYLEVDVKERSVKYLRVPKYYEVPYPANMEVNLVIEFYSR